MASCTSWLPLPQDFRTDLNSLRGIVSASERLKALLKLAGCGLSLIETIQLDRALQEARGLFTLDQLAPSLRLAMVGGPTLEHLLPPLRVAGLRHGLLMDVLVGGYGQHRQAFQNPLSGVMVSDPQAVLLSLTLRDLLPPIAISASLSETDAALAAAVEDLRHIWMQAASPGRIVIQQTVLDTTLPIFGSLDRIVPAAPSRLVAQLNERIAMAAATDGVLLLDVAHAAAKEGTAFWHDPARWLQAKQEIAPGAAPRYADMLARLLAAQRGLSRKCLVLDLDNTLWGGVVGDDGLEGIVLGEGSGAGEAFLSVQRYAKSLRDRGILLAVCSKNDPVIAASAFKDHPEMVLRQSDIGAFVANWDDKAANLRVIAERLNIGLDSLVFLDDNPAERARIRHDLPMVAVPELPDDAALYAQTLAAAGYFESIAFTDADRDRAGQYAVIAQREAARQSAGSMESYLHSLEMRVTAGPFAPADLTRVTQLFNKTNQFNTTTRRYTLDEISQAAKANNVLTFQFRLEDRFGDNGLVSTLILRPVDECQELMELENWVMSCRVFGRELEYEAFSIVADTARNHGTRTIRAEFIPTSKNGVINNLFESLGFSQDSETGKWLLELSDYQPRHTHITRVGQ